MTKIQNNYFMSKPSKANTLKVKTKINKQMNKKQWQELNWTIIKLMGNIKMIYKHRYTNINISSEKTRAQTTIENHKIQFFI